MNNEKEEITCIDIFKGLGILIVILMMWMILILGFDGIAGSWRF